MTIQMRSAFVPHDLRQPVKGAASGPLAGLSVAVKDMFDIVGERVSGGNPDWLATQPLATKNAGAVQTLLDAGATIIGKTVCDEFFYSVTGANTHYGTPVNPRAPGRLPGGSSGGSASATASGACDLALGSDTGGSVRIPASFCGIYGLRPTIGRVDDSGAMAMASSFDAPGWFAASPGAFCKGAVLLDRNTVRAPIDRLRVLDDAFEQADADVATLLRAALAAMATTLPKAEATRIAPEGFDGWRDAIRIIQAYEVWENYGAFVEAHKPTFGPGISERIAFAATVSADAVSQSRAVHDAARQYIRNEVPPGTILALPTAPCIAPMADIAGEEAESFRVRVMRLTCIAGISGLPQVSIPVGTVSGCPVGLSFIGWAGGDEALLDLAWRVSRFCGMAA
jgi:amidase